MNTRRLTYTALFIALGVILPQAFHMIGGPGIGSILLPMHIPVLVGGIILGPVSGVVIGITSVMIGFLLGMPTFPMAAFMLFELGFYGLVAGYLGNTRRLNPYIALIGAMIGGRLVSLVAMQIAIRLIGIQLPPVFGTIAIFSAGIPGIIVQIVIVPALVYLFKRYLNVDGLKGASRNA